MRELLPVQVRELQTLPKLLALRRQPRPRPRQKASEPWKEFILLLCSMFISLLGFCGGRRCNHLLSDMLVPRIMREAQVATIDPGRIRLLSFSSVVSPILGRSYAWKPTASRNHLPARRCRTKREASSDIYSRSPDRTRLRSASVTEREGSHYRSPDKKALALCLLLIFFLFMPT